MPVEDQGISKRDSTLSGPKYKVKDSKDNIHKFYQTIWQFRVKRDVTNLPKTLYVDNI